MLNKFILVISLILTAFSLIDNQIIESSIWCGVVILSYLLNEFQNFKDEVRADIDKNIKNDLDALIKNNNILIREYNKKLKLGSHEVEKAQELINELESFRKELINSGLLDDNDQKSI